ncbi:MAG: arlS 1 [Firmicutes bacterium]|nr:arlS 1 [Bacillota bacterium]
MWSKIKPRRIPISTKLTILYAGILFCILFLASFLTVAGLTYVLFTQANDDIILSLNSVNRYFASGNKVNQNLLDENLIVPGIILRVFDEQNQLLIDSAPNVPVNPTLSDEDDDRVIPDEYKLKSSARIVHIGHVHFYFKKHMVWQDDHVYQIQLMKPTSEQIHFLKTLVKSLLVTNLLGLLIAIISGTFISRRILRPIRDITDTAKNIEVSNLDKRIRVTESNDELQELAKTFNHMLGRIQSGFEQQRRFVSDASHELRTPITVISGYADMLDRWGKEEPSVLDESVGAIKSEAANMYSLIEKLLFLARADQSKLVINKIPVNMKFLVDEVIQETRLIAPNHKIELLKNDSAVISADIASIKQMLRVFIENSIKYTPAGGTISVDSRKNLGHLEITVKDTGIGIPEDEQAKVFDRFYRVDQSRSKVTGGTGLGLSIANWIAKRHSSSIELTSELGEGTSITVIIPLASIDRC